MGAIGLITGIVAAGLGLYLLSIWLIEYDSEFHATTTTRLPPPVLAGHVLAAVTGLALWISYLIWGSHRLAWYALIALALAAALGTTMAIRWLSVYRAKRSSIRTAARFLAAPAAGSAFGPSGRTFGQAADAGPPERNFPLTVVIAHGAFAVATLTLVLLTALRVVGLPGADQRRRLRPQPLGTSGPRPVRCNASRASPTRARLSGAKMAVVAIAAA
jgi:manganese efflux pump family protein